MTSTRGQEEEARAREAGSREVGRAPGPADSSRGMQDVLSLYPSDRNVSNLNFVRYCL